MPPPRIQAPQFSVTGRYLLDVRERRDPTTPNYFHDTENYQEECGIADMPSGSVSRFNNRQWAEQRGFVRCLHCFQV